MRSPHSRAPESYHQSIKSPDRVGEWGGLFLLPEGKVRLGGMEAFGVEAVESVSSPSVSPTV